MVLFPAQLVALFTNDPLIVAAATPPLRAAGLVQPALAVSFILLGALRGAGDTRWPLYSRLLTTWVVRLPLTVVVVGWLGGGLPGVWLAMCTDFTLQAIMVLWRFNSGKWRQIEL
jgi:Na+-driven multidrug efflux pump